MPDVSIISSAPIISVGRAIESTLQSGPWGVLSLTAVAAALLVPLTQYKNVYGISVGYGLSVAALGVVLRSVFDPAILSVGDLLTASTIFYGVRLSLFLLWRDVFAPMPRTNRPEPDRLSRIPFALSLALFYALEMTPVLYALRDPTATATAPWLCGLDWVGTALAWLGAILEAVADTQKARVKAQAAAYSDTSNGESKIFQGPTEGVYRWTRHPNYTGEVLYWIGVWLAGVPSFGPSVVGWLAGTAGLYSIVTIMKGATAGLEKRQAEKYQGQPRYEEWKLNVPATLFPFVRGDSIVKQD